jgi:uncharacterized protein (TIGR00255 family)
MIKSMTGYGLGLFENQMLTVRCEVKSLNSKFLDLNLKLPRSLGDKEFEAREIINKVLERGKVSVGFELEYKQETKKRLKVNKELAKAYYRELYDTAVYLGAPDTDLFRLVMQLPEVVSSDNENEHIEDEWNACQQALSEALKSCDAFRLQEGLALLKSFEEGISLISEQLQQIAQIDPQRAVKVKERIIAHLERSDIPPDQIDRNRLEQEIIFYLEKLDISEEKVRLTQHLEFFTETLHLPASNGKKLNFIAQEMGREINTIGSKANDASMQRMVVTMKEELEKIKEQVMNIL